MYTTHFNPSPPTLSFTFISYFQSGSGGRRCSSNWLILITSFILNSLSQPFSIPQSLKELCYWPNLNPIKHSWPFLH